MKRRIYVIAALAMINLVIMKYHELKSERKGNNGWIVAGSEQRGADSLLSSKNR